MIRKFRHVLCKSCVCMCYTRTIKSENVNEKNYVRALYFKNITLGPLSLAASTLIYAKLIQDLMNLVSCWKPFFNYPKKKFFFVWTQTKLAGKSLASGSIQNIFLLIIKRSWGRQREMFVWIKNHGWMGEVSMLECQFMLKFPRGKKIVHVKWRRDEKIHHMLHAACVGDFMLRA